MNLEGSCTFLVICVQNLTARWGYMQAIERRGQSNGSNQELNCMCVEPGERALWFKWSIIRQSQGINTTDTILGDGDDGIIFVTRNTLQRERKRTIWHRIRLRGLASQAWWASQTSASHTRILPVSARSFGRRRIFSHISLPHTFIRGMPASAAPKSQRERKENGGHGGKGSGGEWGKKGAGTTELRHDAVHASTRIVIIGGGIGGLAAALALAKRGFKVRVLEKDPSFLFRKQVCLLAFVCVYVCASASLFLSLFVSVSCVRTHSLSPSCSLARSVSLFPCLSLCRLSPSLLPSPSRPLPLSHTHAHKYRDMG